MRLALVAAIWIVLLGGLVLFMHSREENTQTLEMIFESAAAKYGLELVTTFAVEPDPFALQTDASDAPAALLVRLNGKEVMRKSKRLERGAPIKLESVPDLLRGHNEFYIEANPPLEQSSGANAVRMRLLRDGSPIAEKTLWAEPGGKIAATFSVTVEEHAQEHGKRHE